MTKRQISKASKRRLLIFGTLSFLVIGYFGYSLITYSYSLTKLSRESEKLKQELYDLKEDENYLKTEIEKLNDPDYIARYAREKYQYTKDGEIVIRIEKKETKKSDKRVEKINFQYLFLGCGLLFIIIVILLIRKKMK